MPIPGKGKKGAKGKGKEKAKSPPASAKPAPPAPKPPASKGGRGEKGRSTPEVKSSSASVSDADINASDYIPVHKEVVIGKHCIYLWIYSAGNHRKHGTDGCRAERHRPLSIIGNMS